MRRIILLVAFFLIVAASRAQIGPPSVPVTGSLGTAGNFPLCNAGSINFTADANVTMGSPQPSACTIKLTSSVSLTATRSLFAPLFFGSSFTFYNDTNGSQTVNICGSTGSCASVPNDGLPHWVGSDGVNYYGLGTGSVAGVTNITGTSTVSGGIIFTGPNVTQTGNTFTFGGAAGAYVPTNFSTITTVNQSNGANIFWSNTNSGNYSPQSHAIQMYNYGPGYDCGNNGSSCQGWSGFGGISMDLSDLARGIAQGIRMNFTHSGQGDTAGFYMYGRHSGGSVASSDEAINGIVSQLGQKGYGLSTVAGSPAAGAVFISTPAGVACTNGACDAMANYHSHDDGFILFDKTQAGATATLATVTPAAGVGGIQYTITGATVTPSTATGSLGTCTNNGIGQWQTYTQTTCNINLTSGTFVVSGSQTSCAAGPPVGTSLDIGLVGGFQEEAYVVAVGTPSGGVQSITFCTRYAWNNSAGGFVGQGGPVGQAIVATSTITGWPIAYAIAGATNSTTLVGSNCNLGSCNNGNLLGPATPITFFPHTYVTGSIADGVSVNVGTNHLVLANGDVLVDAPTSQYGQVNIRLTNNQTTPGGNVMIKGDDAGPFAAIPLVFTGNVTAASAAQFLGYYGDGIRFGHRMQSGAMLHVVGGGPDCEDIFKDDTSYGQITYCGTANTMSFNSAHVIANSYQESLISDPANSTALTCTTGQTFDSTNYHYVCVSTNTTKRVGISTF